jgi:hypothetical protein
MNKRNLIERSIDELSRPSIVANPTVITVRAMLAQFLEDNPISDTLQVSQAKSAPALPNGPVFNFKELTKKMAETYERKNHDYGNSFDISMDEEGLAAARIRMGDKWLRFKQLSKGEEALVKDESIRDTLLDMANYAIMTVMWMDNQKKCDNG